MCPCTAPDVTRGIRPSRVVQAVVLIALTMWLSASERAVSSSAAAAERTAHGSIGAARHGQDPGPFRLGTAGGPLGLGVTTVVADLDRDGRPDVAVADRAGRGAHGRRFSIDILLSNAPAQTVTFYSPHRAVTLRLHDIDNDQGLDLIVTAALGDEIVALWLNDGRGGFHEADLGEFGPLLPPGSATALVAEAARAAPAGVRPRPQADFGLVRLARDDLPRTVDDAVPAPAWIPSALLATPAALRGPPSLL